MHKSMKKKYCECKDCMDEQRRMGVIGFGLGGIGGVLLGLFVGVVVGAVL